MTSRAPSPQSDASVLRQLKLLVALLLLSNLALGLFAFYFLRGIDQKYSSLINETVPTLQQLQELTVVIGQTMHGTNPAFVTGSDELRSAMVQRGRDALEREQGMRGTIVTRGWFSANERDRSDIERAGIAFDRSAASVLDLLVAGKPEEATREREKNLRPDYERYLAATRQVTEHAHNESLRTSGRLTARTGNLSRVLLGLGSWPVIMVGLFLSVFALVVVGMLLNVLLRREPSL